MKILESIIWRIFEKEDTIKESVPEFFPIIESDLASSIRVPISNEFVWNYYFLNPMDDGDMFLYKNLEENIISHVVVLKDNSEENVNWAERFIDKIAAEFETPPVFIFHFLKTIGEDSRLLKKYSWMIESNLYFTWHKGKLPVLSWNKVGLAYLEEKLMKE